MYGAYSPLTMKTVNAEVFMPELEVVLHYERRQTLPDALKERAQELGLSVQELCIQFIEAGMAKYEEQDTLKPTRQLSGGEEVDPEAWYDDPQHPDLCPELSAVLDEALLDSKQST